MPVWFSFAQLAVVAIPLLAVGAIARLVWCAGRIRAAVRLKRANLEALATIVGNRPEPRAPTQLDRWRRGRPSYRPVLRYETREGLLIMAPGAASMPLPFIVGARVPVRYHPGEPTIVEITAGPGAGTDAYKALAIAVFALGVITVSGCFWGHLFGVL